MKLLTLIISIILYSGLSHAEIYKWIDADGNSHFGDKKPETYPSEDLTLEINTYTSANVIQSTFNVGSKVIMYSTRSCGYCKKARRYFRKNNIPYTDYDIERNKQAKRRHRKMGATGVPVILVGNKRLNGFNEKSFKRIYKNN